MGDTARTERVFEWLQSSLLQVDIAEIIVHEADEPDALIDLLDAERVTCKDDRDIDLLAMQADRRKLRGSDAKR